MTYAAALVAFTIVTLTARADHGPALLAAGVLTLAALAVAWFVDCARWPAVWTPPRLWSGRYR